MAYMSFAQTSYRIEFRLIKITSCHVMLTSRLSPIGPSQRRSAVPEQQSQPIYPLPVLAPFFRLHL